jgi:hypothetical protein
MTAQAACLLAIFGYVMLSWSLITRSDALAISQSGRHQKNGAGAQAGVIVEPGNVELERGTSLLVLARFPGELPGEVPATVTLVAQDSTGKEIQIPLQKALDDPMFGGRVPSVERDLTYHIEYDGRVSPDYTAKTFEYPALLKADAHVNFPKYTGLAPKEIEDVRRVSVVEGSRLDLNCLLNKPVKSALLVDDENQQTELLPKGTEAETRTAGWTFNEPGEKHFKLLLTDAAGRTNRKPAAFRVSVVPNRAPDLKVAFPSRDLRVSSLQELAMAAEASDDFGLKKLGLVYQTPDGEEKTVSFEQSAAPEEKGRIDHLLAFEKLSVKPDDLLSYYFYAEDIGPDGHPRQTLSDIFFAEVRPFEEIFRQVPPQHGEAGDCKKLIQLQRQVVAGTWNTIRKNPDDPPSPSFQKEVPSLGESQKLIKRLTESFKNKLRDPLLREYADQAAKEMGRAVEQFTAAADQKTVRHLPPAREAAQSAYQTLLKLQSREKRVTQGQSQGQSSSMPDHLDQQLKALKLKNDRDRYETERQARAQQDAAAREALQILNRLRELARRQEDLNDRIRELENALRDAKTSQEREDIARRLKRLQEEQQELLRNLDEVRERMNQEQNRTQMTDARKQVDQTRERVLRASEALEQGQTSKALTEGTRAQRDLRTIEEELRKQTAGQFNEALRELRDDVREIANQEQKIANSLQAETGSTGQTRPSLREAPDKDREGLSTELEQLKQRLADALEKTKAIVEESETAEPLLSKKLYDTLRDMRSFNAEEALEQAARLTRYGMIPDARELEQQAAKSIQKLQAGVEAAAQSILGSEDEALKLAQAELQQLTEAIRRELAANSPEEASPESRSGKPDPRQQASKSPSEDSQNPSSGQDPGSKNGKSSPQGKGKERDGQQGQQPGQGQQGQQPGQGQQGQQPGQGQQGQQPGQGQQGQQPGQGQQGQQPGQGQQGQQPGQGQQGQQPGQGQGQGQASQQPAGSNQGSGSNDSRNRSMSPNPSAQQKSITEQLSQIFSPAGGDGSGMAGPHLPLTGGAFIEWSDRMRDVEEMLSSPELRAQVAMIRDRARLERLEVKRHSKQPNWELVRASIYGPLLELQQQLAEEIARRDPNKNMVPIDRDPVPDQYAEIVKQYYRELSREQPAVP